MTTQLRQFLRTAWREAWSLLYVVSFVGLLMAAYLIANSPTPNLVPRLAQHHAIRHTALQAAPSIKPVDDALAWVFSKRGAKQPLL